MSDERKKQPTEEEKAIEREIRKNRKFTLAEAIGRLAGPGAMKGTSPVPLKQQAVAQIENWLNRNMSGSQSELQAVLLRGFSSSELLLRNFEQPFVVLAAYCQQTLDSEYLLQELVRETDIEWGRQQQERPFFERAGSAPNPNDPYTLESVRKTLDDLIDQLAAKEETEKLATS